MSLHFFGQYLFHNGIIDAQQLREGLRYQKKLTPRTGELAQKLGMMTPGQVRQVLEKQKEVDLPFARLAFIMGFITEKQCGHLLREQRSRSVHLGEALLALGHISEEDFKAHLPGFTASNKDSALDQYQTVNPVVISLAESLSAVWQRFLGRELKLTGCEKLIPDGTYTPITLSMPDHNHGTSCVILLSRGLAGELAEKFAHDPVQKNTDPVLVIFNIAARYLVFSLDNVDSSNCFPKLEVAHELPDFSNEPALILSDPEHTVIVVSLPWES